MKPGILVRSLGLLVVGLLVVLGGLCFDLAGGPAAAGEPVLTLGTGSRAGVYHPLGRALCRLFDASQKGSPVACGARSSAGSVANLRDLRTGKLQLAMAQSDLQFLAVKGLEVFAAEGPDPDLRAMFSLHGEPFTLVARRDAEIEQLEDLAGKRVNIGNPGSGQRGTMEIVMRAMGWTKSTFNLINELPASQQSLALCHDNVQAMVYTAGHPNDSVAQAVRLCDAVIVEVSGPQIDFLVKRYPFYLRMDIPGGIYAGNPHDVRTFGVVATLVTSAKVDADTIYSFTKAVFESLDSLRRLHPALRHLTPERMIQDGLTAPLHDGAIRYYKERGWL